MLRWTLDMCRYLEVFHSATVKMTTFATRCAIGVIWLLPAVIFTPWIFVYRQRTFVVGQHEFVACHADWPRLWMFRAFTVGVVFLTCYLLPLCCIGVFYALIGVRVWRRRVVNLAVQSRAAANIRRSKARLLRMLVTVVVLFAASWLPLYVINMRQMFSTPTDSEKRITERYLGPLAQWLGASNSCVNPFVYCYFSHGFRSGVVGLLRTVFRRSATDSEQMLPRRSREHRPAADVDILPTTGVELQRFQTTVEYKVEVNEEEIDIRALSSQTMQCVL